MVVPGAMPIARPPGSSAPGRVDPRPGRPIQERAAGLDQLHVPGVGVQEIGQVGVDGQMVHRFCPSKRISSTPAGGRKSPLGRL